MVVSGAVEREQVSCCYSVEIIFQCQKIKKVLEICSTTTCI